MLEREGIIAGSSTGTLLAAALRYCREQTTHKRVVTIVGDTGNKYLSKSFNDSWLADQGLLNREKFGDLRDLIARPADTGDIVTVTSDDNLVTTYKRMRMFDVSQLPVMDDGKVVGLSLVTYGVDSRTLTSIPSPGPHALAFIGLLSTVVNEVMNQARVQAQQQATPKIATPTDAARQVVEKTKR